MAEVKIKKLNDNIFKIKLNDYKKLGFNLLKIEWKKIDIQVKTFKNCEFTSLIILKINKWTRL